MFKNLASLRQPSMKCEAIHLTPVENIPCCYSAPSSIQFVFSWQHEFAQNAMSSFYLLATTAAGDSNTSGGLWSWTGESHASDVQAAATWTQVSRNSATSTLILL